VLCLASEGQAPVFRFANNGVDAFNLAVGRKRLADRRRVWCLDGRLLLVRWRPDACLGSQNGVIRKGAAEPAAARPLLPVKNLRHLNRLRPAV
jgi:hypothetical protein